MGLERGGSRLTRSNQWTEEELVFLWDHYQFVAQCASATRAVEMDWLYRMMNRLSEGERRPFHPRTLQSIRAKWANMERLATEGDDAPRVTKAERDVATRFAEETDRSSYVRALYNAYLW